MMTEPTPDLRKAREDIDRWNHESGRVVLNEMERLQAEVDRLKNCCNEMNIARRERDDARAALRDSPEWDAGDECWHTCCQGVKPEVYDQQAPEVQAQMTHRGHRPCCPRLRGLGMVSRGFRWRFVLGDG